MYDGFEDVNQSYSPHAQRRFPTFADVEISGYTRTGVEGRDKIEELLRKSGISREEAVLRLRANVAKKQVAVTIAKAGFAGQVAFKQLEKGYSFHMGGVFTQHPALRPLTPVKCQMYWGPDGKALIIDLGAATAILRQKRKKKTPSEERGEDTE